MKNLQKLFLIFIVISSFSNIDAMSGKPKTTKRVTFHDIVAINYPHRYPFEEQNSTQWQTKNERNNAIQEVFPENNVACKQELIRDLQIRKFMHDRVEALQIKRKKDEEIKADVLFAAKLITAVVVCNFAYIEYKKIYPGSDQNL